MGGKGYKSYTSLTGKKVSGDWEDSDRGAGNKAKRRAGGEVKAKSPTYIAHVINKGKKKVDPKKNPVVKEDKLAESDVPRNSMGKPIRIKDKIKAAKGFIPHKGKPTNEDFIGEVVDKTVVNTSKKIDVMKGKNKIKINPNVGEQVEKPGNSGETPNANVVDPALGRKERRISMMKRQILRKKQQAVMQGAGADIVAHNEPEGKLLTLKPDAQIIEKKDAIKKQSKKECNENETKQTLTNTIRAILENPTNVTELNRYGKETGKATSSINKRAGTPIKKGGSTDKALNYVRTKIRKETGKPEGQQSKSKGEKDRRQPGDRKGTPADTIAKRRESRADAEKLMRDTSGT